MGKRVKALGKVPSASRSWNQHVLRKDGTDIALAAAVLEHNADWELTVMNISKDGVTAEALTYGQVRAVVQGCKMRSGCSELTYAIV